MLRSAIDVPLRLFCLERHVTASPFVEGRECLFDAGQLAGVLGQVTGNGGTKLGPALEISGDRRGRQLDHLGCAPGEYSVVCRVSLLDCLVILFDQAIPLLLAEP